MSIDSYQFDSLEPAGLLALEGSHCQTRSSQSTPGSQASEQSAVCSVKCSKWSVQCLKCSLQWAEELCNVQFTGCTKRKVCSMQCVVCTVFCTPCSMQCASHSVWCAVCGVQRAKLYLQNLQSILLLSCKGPAATLYYTARYFSVTDFTGCSLL